jgi:hypothetical protein
VLAEDQAGHDEARAIVTDVAQDAFGQLTKGTFWSSVLVVTAETASILEMPDASSSIRDLLLPFLDQVAFSGVWVVAPIAYGVGVACAACGDRRAPQFFERAVEIAERIHAPLLATQAREAARSASSSRSITTGRGGPPGRPR